MSPLLTALAFGVVLGVKTPDTKAETMLRKWYKAALDNYRVPTMRDLVDDWAGQTCEVAKCPYFAQADFNGDAVMDIAVILLGRNGAKVRLVTLISKPEGAYAGVILEERILGKQVLERRYMVSVAKPGKYLTAAGKDYDLGPDNRDPKRLHLRHPAINLAYSESANWFYFWDAAAKNFRKVQMSD